MRGADTFTEGLFTLKKLDDFVPSNHPLRVIRTMVNKALAEMGELFAGMYEEDAKGGRPSIAPQKLLRAMLLQVLYSIRSERQLMEQTQYNLLFRWFIGLSMDDAVWVPTVFTKNRERLIEHDAVVAFFNAVLKQADKKKWLSKEHFSVDGTLIQAWAGHKSFVRKDGKDDDDGGDFRGKSRSNETHESSTDPDSRLFRKGKTASELRFMGHTLMENRNGLIVNAMVTQADGHAEREAAKAMVADVRQANPDGELTLGADKGYDAAEFIKALQDIKVTPHVAQNKSNRQSAVPDEIAATEGYSISMQKLGQIHWSDSSGDGARHQEGRSGLHDGHGRLQPRAHAHLGTSPSGGRVMRAKRLEMTSDQVSMGLKSAVWTPRAASIAKKRTLTSAAWLRPLSISAAC